MSRTAREDDLRETALQRLAHARSTTDDLFSLLRPDALYERPIAERHRIIFYLGHLEAFDWNLVGRTAFGLDPCDRLFDELFAFGIDPVGEGLPQDTATDWPSRTQVDRYVEEVRSRMDRLLERVGSGRPEAPFDPTILDVAIEHRLMHAETLAYMLHWLPLNQKRTPDNVRNARRSRSARLPAVATIPPGTATLGMSRKEQAFGWDNEFELTRVHVPEFGIDTRNVTNRDFLEFVNAGGYGDQSLWSKPDWDWRSAAGVEHPRFWERSRGKWMLRTMFEIRPLPGDWPVYISHAEAQAYCRWSARDLPTEAQFHRAAFGTPDGQNRAYPWGDAIPDSTRGNFDFHSWDPVPVGSYPLGDSAFGVADLLGNGWEWTSTVFHPFRGFERFDFYPGYSADFFDDKHFVMKGGSARTASCMLRGSFRNWFQPHYPHIYASFRTVHS